MSLQEVSLSRARVQEEKLVHPCDFMQRSAAQQEEALRLHRIRSTHGLGAATDVALTEMTLGGGRRLGSLPASKLLYHSYRGGLTEISPEDVYGLPDNDPNVQPSARALAEKQVFGYELTMKNLGM